MHGGRPIHEILSVLLVAPAALSAAKADHRADAGYGAANAGPSTAPAEEGAGAVRVVNVVCVCLPPPYDHKGCVRVARHIVLVLAGAAAPAPASQDGQQEHDDEDNQATTGCNPNDGTHRKTTSGLGGRWLRGRERERQRERRVLEFLKSHSRPRPLSKNKKCWHNAQMESFRPSVVQALGMLQSRMVH